MEPGEIAERIFDQEARAAGLNDAQRAVARNVMGNMQHGMRTELDGWLANKAGSAQEFMLAFTTGLCSYALLLEFCRTCPGEAMRTQALETAAKNPAMAALLAELKAAQARPRGG